MEKVGIFYDHLEYFTAIWYILWPFGIVCGHLVYFIPFWYVKSNKNLATLILGRVSSDLQAHFFVSIVPKTFRFAVIRLARWCIRIPKYQNTDLGIFWKVLE
jgi:hypothetical protein